MSRNELFELFSLLNGVLKYQKNAFKLYNNVRHEKSMSRAQKQSCFDVEALCLERQKKVDMKIELSDTKKFLLFEGNFYGK